MFSPSSCWRYYFFQCEERIFCVVYNMSELNLSLLLFYFSVLTNHRFENYGSERGILVWLRVHTEGDPSLIIILETMVEGTWTLWHYLDQFFWVFVPLYKQRCNHQYQNGACDGKSPVCFVVSWTNSQSCSSNEGSQLSMDEIRQMLNALKVGMQSFKRLAVLITLHGRSSVNEETASITSAQMLWRQCLTSCFYYGDSATIWRRQWLP